MSWCFINKTVLTYNSAVQFLYLNPRPYMYVGVHMHSWEIHLKNQINIFLSDSENLHYSTIMSGYNTLVHSITNGKALQLRIVEPFIYFMVQLFCSQFFNSFHSEPKWLCCPHWHHVSANFICHSESHWVQTVAMSLQSLLLAVLLDFRWHYEMLTNKK